MKSNEQVLSDVNKLLNRVRDLKAMISERHELLTALSGRTQKRVDISINGINLTVNRVIMTPHQRVKPEYKTAITFISRGLNEEIEQFESEIKTIKSKLNQMKIGDEL